MTIGKEIELKGNIKMLLFLDSMKES